MKIDDVLFCEKKKNLALPQWQFGKTARENPLTQLLRRSIYRRLDSRQFIVATHSCTWQALRASQDVRAASTRARATAASRAIVARTRARAAHFASVVASASSPPRGVAT